MTLQDVRDAVADALFTAERCTVYTPYMSDWGSGHQDGLAEALALIDCAMEPDDEPAEKTDEDGWAMELGVLLRIEALLADRLPNPHTDYKLAEVDWWDAVTPPTTSSESADDRDRDNLLRYYEGLVAEYRDVVDRIEDRLDDFNRLPYQNVNGDVLALVSDLQAVLNGEVAG